MSKLFKCSKCGKEFSYDSPALERWASSGKAKPEQIKCPDCFGNKAPKAEKIAKEANSTEVKNPISKPSYKRPLAKPSGSSGKSTMSAELLREKYLQLVEVFADEYDEVKEFLGGWTTTLALSETR